MSKYVKNLITKDLTKRFDGVEAVGVINPRGLDATKNNALRRKMRENGLRVTVVKNSLAKRAVEGSKLTGFDKLLEGPSAIIYGKETSISTLARLLLDEKKANEKIELRGIFFDGEVYTGDAGVKTVSTMPTREEAISNVLSALLGPGKKLAAALKGPGGTLGAVLKTIETKAKERGDSPDGDAAPAAAAPTADAAPAADAPAAS
ncbi:50S ribosomal protein L10 [Humisphaera borealis]|uniref:Large ribosomal subunit protein uL10 n=1 Tax=Humisphaera borealis TaxID=2807512 RepID=A0A7M2WUU0_9BACT|nr:50S ribosomal protein L10 [Humisphaera borealis]QOV89209.1 50S ribosomal protein L10 [Humisphaera borealis]